MENRLDQFSHFGSAAAVSLLALQLLAIALWRYQNSDPPRLGGRISLVKAFWFVYVVTLWVAVPCLLFFSFSNRDGAAKWIFGLLASSMLIRVAIELRLCLATRTWKVVYGIAHDVFHLALSIGLLLWSTRHAVAQHLSFIAAILLLTIFSLAGELLFATWFKRATAGPESGVYFVSDSRAHRSLNARTAWIFLPQYFVFLSIVCLSLEGKPQ